MKKTLGAGVIFFLLALMGSSFADTVYLKNGRQISGVITRQNSDSIELSVKIGTLKFYTSQIDHTVRSDSAAAKAIVDSWDKERREVAQAAQSVSQEAAAEQNKQVEEPESPKQKNATQESAAVQAAEPEVKTPKKEGSAAVKGERLGNHLVVTALLNKKVKVRLIVDSGASSVLLSMEKTNELKGVHIRKYDMPDSMGKVADGRSVESVSFKLDSLSVGGMEAEEVDAQVVLKGQKIGEGIDGLLGMSYLKNFKFQLDLPNNQLILERPGKK